MIALCPKFIAGLHLVGVISIASAADETADQQRKVLCGYYINEIARLDNLLYEPSLNAARADMKFNPFKDVLEWNVQLYQMAGCDPLQLSASIALERSQRTTPSAK
jgi:hypothetical protein